MGSGSNVTVLVNFLITITEKPLYLDSKLKIAGGRGARSTRLTNWWLFRKTGNDIAALLVKP